MLPPSVDAPLSHWIRRSWSPAVASRATITHARLQRLDLVDRQNGGWRITDPEWADWVRKART
ncbi:MAG: hypothetical protein OXH52_10125 [Gammaproteobacteria bacterium]|nr:hypothetical protein [Gammaproteobacteria bacterium]